MGSLSLINKGLLLGKAFVFLSAIGDNSIGTVSLSNRFLRFQSKLKCRVELSPV